MQELRTKLHHWYQHNKRNLPWRDTRDAYLIWLSEIILQQTQVKQGLPYYLKFSQTYPKVQDLAKADEEEVLKLWQGLGYYSRARNLHSAAKQVIAHYNGTFPTRYEDLITLKGVGDYTASAVASFSSEEAKACVDGNVIRVISRLFDVDIAYDTSAGQKMIKALASEFLDKNNTSTHNQAIMEFGALHCTPKNPDCERCILQDKCIAFAKHKVTQLPFKSKRTKVEDLYLYYFVFLTEKDTLIQQRSSNGIWKNMYEFPLLESPAERSKEDLLSHISTLSKEPCEIHFSSPYKHLLSHRKIKALFIEIKCKDTLPSLPETKTIAQETMSKYPVSRLMERYWNDFKQKD